MNKQPLTLNWLESLLSRLGRTASEHQLCLETPLLGNLPVFLRLLVDDGIVMLQVAAKALGLKTSPEHELVHGRGVLRPLGEHVGVERELLLESMDDIEVFEEEDLWLVGWLIILCYFEQLRADSPFTQGIFSRKGGNTYSTISSLEPVKLLLRFCERLRGDHRLQHLLNHLPELVVIGL